MSTVTSAIEPLPADFSTKMSDWVPAVEAPSLCGKAYSTIDDNSSKGRIPFRVKEGHKHFLRSWISQFKGVNKGNPKRIKNPVMQLEGASQIAFNRLRESLESSHDDVIYEFLHDHEGISVRIYVVANDKKVLLETKLLASRERQPIGE